MRWLKYWEKKMQDPKPFYITGKIVSDKRDGKWRKLYVMNGPAQWMAWLDTERHSSNHELVLDGSQIKFWVLKKVDDNGIEYNEVEQIILT